MRAIATCLALGLMTSVAIANDNLSEPDSEDGTDVVENQSEVDVIAQLVVAGEQCSFAIDDEGLSEHASDIDLTAADQVTLINGIQAISADYAALDDEQKAGFCTESEELAQDRNLL